MSSEFQSIFVELRTILEKHRGGLTVKEDSSDCYCLKGKVGPATLKAWGGRAKVPNISVAWVQIGKAYVSFHLMGLYGNNKLIEGMSKQLKARMQGKTCFNFKTIDKTLFDELDYLTGSGMACFRKAGFVATTI